jgi:GMP synthase-like glutamine amidotransferase
MKIAVLQHIAFEGPGMIVDWARENESEIIVYESYNGVLPEFGSFDLLIVLGGPMSANDESANDNFDWLEQEKLLIKRAIDENVLVFGICLGAQLIAKVLGGVITKNPEKEIGWYPLECMYNFLKPEFLVFHWHGETFSIPEGAQLIASSKACANQAFVYGDNVLALQFHLEMNEAGIRDIVLNCESELGKGNFVQTKIELLSNLAQVEACRVELFDILDGLKMRLGEMAQ